MTETEQVFETLGVSTSLMVLTLPEQVSEVAELHGIEHAAHTNGLRKYKLKRNRSRNISLRTRGYKVK